MWPWPNFLLFFSFLFSIYFNTSLVPCVKCALYYKGKATAVERALWPIPMQYFCVSKQWYFGFLMAHRCWCMLFYTESLTQHQNRVSAKRWLLGGNIPCRGRELNQYCTWLFGLTLYLPELSLQLKVTGKFEEEKKKSHVVPVLNVGQVNVFSFCCLDQGKCHLSSTSSRRWTRSRQTGSVESAWWTKM